MYLRINAFALSGRQCYGKFITQGVASLALGYALLGFQPVHYRRHLNNSSERFMENLWLIDGHF